ncbi:hypothetical protein GC177_04750 [bacterium]|nr:hypothetical protein [bacterium]
MLNNREIALHLQRQDYDRYLMSMRAPAALRPALHTLLALNLEASRVRESTSDEMTGLIRLTWWREALAELREGKLPRAHPLVERLAAQHIAENLPEALVDEWLGAREKDLETAPIMTVEDLLHYADGTGGCLAAMWLALACPDATQQATQAARNAGIAWALVGILRAIPYHAEHGLVLLPHNLLKLHGLSAEAILHGDGLNALSPVNMAILEQARISAHAAWNARKHVPRHGRAVMLHAWLALRYLDIILPEKPWEARGPRQRPLCLARLALLSI